jgi:hypothetical protein
VPTFLPLVRRALILPAGVSTLAALIAVGAVGTVTLSATTAAERGGAVPAAAAVRPTVLLDAAPRAPRTVAARKSSVTAAAPRAAKPTAKAAAAPAHKAVAVTRWIPKGTGMWIYEWNRTAGGNAKAVVRRAQNAGLTHLFVRTGSTHDGFTGTKVLRQILPATGGTSLKVIAWDFPTLKNPVADAKRLARAATYRRTRGGPHVAAVAPDIETPAEGTRNSWKRVASYLKTLRRLLPADVAILTTVPWPSVYRVGAYPYTTVAKYSDALLPMAYWYSNNVRHVTATSINYLRRFHKPVQPVGQGYDSKIDVPALSHSNLRKQVPVFLETAHKYGVGAVSLWSWQSAPRVTWHAIANARKLFPAK